jgi:hypothetical protein
MAKTRGVTCGDCYFRQAGLCALQRETPCPTFRVAACGTLAPPRQLRLIPRGLAGLAAQD